MAIKQIQFTWNVDNPAIFQNYPLAPVDLETFIPVQVVDMYATTGANPFFVGAIRRNTGVNISTNFSGGETGVGEWRGTASINTAITLAVGNFLQLYVQSMPFGIIQNVQFTVLGEQEIEEIPSAMVMFMA